MEEAKKKKKALLEQNKKITKTTKGKKENTDVTKGVKRKQVSLFDMQVMKKPKMDNKFTLSDECNEWIKKDIENEQHWKECQETLSNGKSVFLDKVMEIFMCVCCQEMADKPITLSCKHNVCKVCCCMFLRE